MINRSKGNGSIQRRAPGLARWLRTRGGARWLGCRVRRVTVSVFFAVVERESQGVGRPLLRSRESTSAKKARLHQTIARQRAALSQLEQQREAAERELRELEIELAGLEPFSRRPGSGISLSVAERCRDGIICL